MKRLPKSLAEIVAYTHLQSNISDKEISLATGYSLSQIREAKKFLLKEKIIRECPYINVYILGFYQFGIFFSLANNEKEIRKKLENFLVQSENISWICQVSGEYDYGISICSRSLNDVVEFFNLLSDSLGLIISSKVTSIRVKLTDYPLKCLSEKSYEIKEITWGICAEKIEFDELDHRILSALSSNEYSSISELSETINIPWSSLKYRLKNLEENKVLVKNTYAVRSSFFGIQTFLLLIYTKGLSDNNKTIFYEFCRKHQNIGYLVECLGNWDFEVAVKIRSEENLFHIVRELHDAFNEFINSIKILPIYGYPKISMYPFKKHPLFS